MTLKNHLILIWRWVHGSVWTEKLVYWPIILDIKADNSRIFLSMDTSFGLCRHLSDAADARSRCCPAGTVLFVMFLMWKLWRPGQGELPSSVSFKRPAAGVFSHPCVCDDHNRVSLTGLPMSLNLTTSTTSAPLIEPPYTRCVPLLPVL